MLHTSYRGAVKENLFTGDHVSRETFMLMLADIWGDWASQETVRKAFKTCGVTTDGLDVELMQADKFAAAKSVTQEEEESASPKTPANQKPAWEAPSPVNVKKGSRAYFKMKYESMSKKYKETLESPITPEDIPAFSKVDKFKPKKIKNFRITQVTGSLEAKDVYKKRLEMEAVEETKKQTLQDKKDKKDQERKAFLRCKDACCCEGERCQAANLKQCSVCESVIKSQCTKAQCKLIASGKPKMLVAGSQTIPKDAKKTTKRKSKSLRKSMDQTCPNRSQISRKISTHLLTSKTMMIVHLTRSKSFGKVFLLQHQRRKSRVFGSRLCILKLVLPPFCLSAEQNTDF